MKRVLILTDNGPKKDISPSGKSSYELLYRFAYNHGIEFCRSSISDYDTKTKSFSWAQFFSDHWHWKKDIVPDLVYDKTPFYLSDDLIKQRKLISEQFIFRNSLIVSKLMSNKWLTYELLKDFSPQTILVENPNDISKISLLPSEHVILKPLAGSGGDGIGKILKNEIKPPFYPFLVQEIISTSGIPGIISGQHDLRVIMHNTNPVYSFVRIPADGQFLANIAQGGTLSVVDIDHLPAEIIDTVKKIASVLKSYGNSFYAIDLMLNDKGIPMLIELNSRPGLTLEPVEIPYSDRIYGSLVDFLIKE